MALIASEVIGLARVSVTVPVIRAPGPPPSAAYDYSNGFDAVTVKGAQPGAPVILLPATGVAVLFLSEPVAPGTKGTQGGLKATVDPVAVSTASSPTPALAPVTLRWYYGAYALSLTGLYQGVDPEKAIVIEATDSNGDPFAQSFQFDISVVRDPMTEFAAKQFVG